MRRLHVGLLATLALMVFASSAMAQDDDRKKDRPKDRPAKKRPGERDFRPPPNPLIEALDTDKDGEISAEEISKAAVALKKLDKNGDGKLTRDELRPTSRPGGPGGPDGRRFDPFAQFDKNKDGKLTKDELPERAARIIDFADANKDGAVTKEEFEKARENARKKRPEGKDRPEGKKRPDGKKRPKRPADN